jgi:three-Cys-motif partner protein
MSTADTNPEYWSEYSNLQHVKHCLIKNYLNGWFPKMTLGPTGCRRLMYIDTHAGRGKHLDGKNLGSPLVALTTLLDHTSWERMLKNTEVHYYFIERDEENVAALREELAKLPLPRNVFVEAESGDCFDVIQNAVADFETGGGRMAPSFIFVDPYGFKLPGKLLRKLLTYPKVELFVNVIWRELDMAIKLVRGEAKPKQVDATDRLFGDIGAGPSVTTAQRQANSKASLEATLDSVFDGNGWRKIGATDADQRADQCAGLFREITGARWGTHLRMLDNDRVRYFLLHLTKHDAGRDLMKECMWKACPDGGFYASKSDNPSQVVLIQPEPDLKPLRGWVTDRLKAGSKRWQQLTEELREELWMGKHLNEVVRDMRRAGEIVGSEYTGQFALTNDPLLSLPSCVGPK